MQEAWFNDSAMLDSLAGGDTARQRRKTAGLRPPSIAGTEPSGHFFGVV
jgi:hypothetical protein